MTDLLGRLGRYLVQGVTIDSRTLALFRIAAGLLIIGDVLARSGTFRYFYTENGVVPQELAEARTIDNAFSFFFYTQNDIVIALLFLIHAIVAIQLIIGYKTRFATILSFLFVISLDHHNPLVLSHADTLFRLLMFWAIFIPIGERWSVDALQRERPARASVVSLGTAAILLQMVYMYTVNGVHKLNGELWVSRDATPLIFGLDDMTYFLAGPLRQFPAVLEIMGTMWFLLILFSLLLLFLRGRARYVHAFLLFGAHFSFAVTVRIGAFGWVGMAGVLLFFPAAFWDDLHRLAVRLNLWDRVVVPTHDRLYAFGDRAARSLPAFRVNLGIPTAVRDAAYDVGMTFLIMALFIFPTIHFLAEEDVIDWQRSVVEERIDETLRIVAAQQSRWTVFAPTPRTTDRYYVFAARTADGDLLDAFNDRPFTFERPYDELQNIYGNYRERFYMNSVRRAGQTGTPPGYLAGWHCREYADRGIELTHINMYVINERITLETIDDHPNREKWGELMSTHACGDHTPEEFELPEELP
jgi:hypothetical protein